MRNVLFPIAFIGSASLLACSFSLRAGTPNNPPNNPPPPATTPAATPAPAPRKPVAQGPIHHIGKRPAGQPTGPTPAPTNTSTAPAPAPTTPPTPGGIPVVNTATAFGSGAVDPTGFKGSIYWIDKASTKLPALASMQPVGYLFASELNVSPQAFTSGFPGVDPAHKDNFAISYAAPLVVTTEADYDFRLLADDGAVMKIDSTPILDNDGVKTAPGTKEGPVHLVVGTHVIQVDYFQTTGNVALQLFWRKANDTTDAIFHPGSGAAPAPTPSGSATSLPSSLPTAPAGTGVRPPIGRSGQAGG